MKKQAAPPAQRYPVTFAHPGKVGRQGGVIYSASPITPGQLIKIGKLKLTVDTVDCLGPGKPQIGDLIPTP